MTAVSSHRRLGTRGKPEESRAAILKAALSEFADHGIDGARMDAIAKRARVNKALLYYYFKSKDALYEAVILYVFTGMRDRLSPVLESDASPRQKILDFAATYFDYIAQKPNFPRAIHAGRSHSAHQHSQQMHQMTGECMRPVYQQLGKVLHEGIDAGEFRPFDPEDLVPTLVAIIIFYFVEAQVIRNVSQEDPLSPKRLAKHRVFILDFISSALFTHPQRKQGARV